MSPAKLLSEDFEICYENQNHVNSYINECNCDKGESNVVSVLGVRDHITETHKMIEQN